MPPKHAFRARGVHVSAHDLQSVQRVHGESEQSSKNTNFDHHHQDRWCGRFDHRWALICAAEIELHYARGISYRFHTGKSEYDADEAGPVLPERSMHRF